MNDRNFSRWQAAQLKEDEFWRRRGVVDGQAGRVLARYAPIIGQVSRDLDPGARVLDVGCGPTCAGQLFPVGSKSYLDPLMDSYVQTYGRQMPEGKKICATAEDIPERAETFDAVICVNALDHMIDPDRALEEISRVMKEGATLILGVFVHPRPIAALRMFLERWVPLLREDAHPYSYTVRTARELLDHHFMVEQSIRVYRKRNSRLAWLHREDWVFVCRKQSPQIIPFQSAARRKAA